MAKFSFNGMDEISASFEQLSRLTDDDKMSVIMPAAQLLLQRQKEKILSLFTQRTGDLANSLTIEKRSGEVWQLLGEIKTDFSRFAEMLETTRHRLDQAGETIDSAVSRTRTIRKKLSGLEDLPGSSGESGSRELPS